MKNLLWLSLILLFTSCAAQKEILYFQDVVSLKEEVVDKGYEAKVHKDDLLAIMVNSKDPELALPFNLPVVNFQNSGGQTSGHQNLLGYLVNQNGDIDFPILGKLHVEGLTRMQLIELIKRKLIDEDFIKDPIVTVQFLNYKISVLGEVTSPGSFNISGDRITLLEALGMAGDLTIYGRRDRVAVIREQDGKRQILYHDLRSSDIFQSPSYYLQQNDIIYVEPNKPKSGQSRVNSNNNVGVWMSGVSVLTSVAALLINIFK